MRGCRFAEMFIKMLVVLSVGYNASPVENKCKSGNLQDGVGVYVPSYDKYFGCEYLRDNLTSDRNVGIYKNRDEYCNSVTTDCCATCDEIRCKDVGIVLAETPFDCKYLLMGDPAYNRLGIYKNREKLCQQKTTTECCQTCKKVKNATGSFSSTVVLTPTETRQTKPSPQQTTHPNLGTEIKEPELQDECVNHCFRMGDGSFGTCKRLWEMEDRTDICMNGFAMGCKKTCRDILTVPLPL